MISILKLSKNSETCYKGLVCRAVVFLSMECSLNLTKHISTTCLLKENHWQMCVDTFELLLKRNSAITT